MRFIHIRWRAHEHTKQQNFLWHGRDNDATDWSRQCDNSNYGVADLIRIDAFSLSNLQLIPELLLGDIEQ